MKKLAAVLVVVGSTFFGTAFADELATMRQKNFVAIFSQYDCRLGNFALDMEKLGADVRGSSIAADAQTVKGVYGTYVYTVRAECYAGGKGPDVVCDFSDPNQKVSIALEVYPQPMFSKTLKNPLSGVSVTVPPQSLENISITLGRDTPFETSSDWYRAAFTCRHAGSNQ